METWLNQRNSGMWMHISCLPSTQGIGCFDENANEFLKFLADSRIKYWQICPLGPLTYGDSPYQCISSFAINPYFINLKQLVTDKLLTQQEFDSFQSHMSISQGKVNYGILYEYFLPLLHQAACRFIKNKQYFAFIRRNKFWLDSFSTFQALKTFFSGKSWQQWPMEYRKFPVDQQLTKETIHEIECHKIIQYFAYAQWNELKNHATENNIQIIGDLPFYPGLDSSDVWANQDSFLLDQYCHPTAVAGVPPDYFSPDGQLWGNPLYNWEFLRHNKYSWLFERLKHAFNLYDIVRLDHFRAFANYWSVKSKSNTAKNGIWNKGPDINFFKEFQKYFPQAKFIAEDLGELDDRAKNLLSQTGFPGMKILQFAFSLDSNNVYLPHNHCKNSILYSGTHDNDTVLGWYNSIDENIKNQVREYFGISNDQIQWKFLQELYRSTCNLSIISPQDLLNLSSEFRFNTPGSTENNWQWRMTPEQFAALKSRSQELATLASLYGRSY